MLTRLRLALVFFILSGFLVIAPSAEAASVRVTPTSGPPGTTFTFLLTGLPPSFSVTCRVFNSAGQQIGLGPCTGVTNGFGELLQSFGTAEGYTAGGQYRAAFYDGSNTLLTEASFEVVLPQQRCFPETGQCIRGKFLKYWYERGALFFNGFPLSAEFTEVLEDGRLYTVQYFERVRLELHPENPAPYDILLGQFGRRIHPADPPVPQKPNAIYFAETGHNVENPFASFLAGVTSESPIGIEYFGYPISESLQERLEDGNVYTVQYFERARLELHPGGRILLGQFGRRFLPTQLPSPSPTPAPSFGPGWLDRPPILNWNRAGAPIPLAPANISPRDSFCPPLLTGFIPELQAVIAAGWQTPFEPTIKGDVVIVLGSAGADGMCRPLQYQEFVFVRGRFAGTLSPILMNARTDEALGSATISDDRRTITALYTRYNGTEPLCCPSRISTLQFAIDPDLPLITPGSVFTQPTP